MAKRQGLGSCVWVSVNLFPTEIKLDLVLPVSAALRAISGSGRSQLLQTRLGFGQQLMSYMKEAVLAGLSEYISSHIRTD